MPVGYKETILILPQLNTNIRKLKRMLERGGRAGIVRPHYKYWLHFGGQCPLYKAILTKGGVLLGVIAK